MYGKYAALDDGKESIKVVVRVRECIKPADAFSIGRDNKSITLRQSKADLVDNKPKDEQELLEFSCNTVLSNASQDKTFDVVGKQATEAVLAGYNGTVLCYGQTGAGKSFTMVGSRDNYHQRGVAARAIAHAFHEAANRPADEYIFKFSCLEIYNDQMYDLLSTLPSEGPRRELSLTELKGKVEVKGLLAPVVESEEAALQLLFEAESNRAVAQHQLNVLSSRSHVLYMLSCEKRSKVASGAVVNSRLHSRRPRRLGAFKEVFCDLTGRLLGRPRLRTPAAKGGDVHQQIIILPRAGRRRLRRKKGPRAPPLVKAHKRVTRVVRRQLQDPSCRKRMA